MGISLDGTNDRLDLGLLGDFGSYVTNSAGFTLMCWTKLGVDSTDSVASLLPCFNQNSVSTNSQSLWWFLNAGYTTGITNSVGSVLINLGDETDTGFLYHEVLYGATTGWNDQGWHHHAITIIAQPLGSRAVSYYFDGVLQCGPAVGDWANTPFNDAMGSVIDYSRSPGPPLGARSLTNNTSWFDWTQGEFEDARIYKRALSANEIQAIYQCGGRDSVQRNLFRRWPLFRDGVDYGPFQQSATPANGPTFTTALALEGYRRRRSR